VQQIYIMIGKLLSFVIIALIGFEWKKINVDAWYVIKWNL